MSTLAGSLDTNVLARLLINDRAAQHQAVLQLLENTNRQFAIADTALVELAFVLERHYEFDRPTVSHALEGILAMPVFNCNRMLFSRALPLFVAHPSLSMEDCCLASYAELNNAQPLWTFDQKLAKQAPHTQLVPPAKSKPKP